MLHGTKPADQPVATGPSGKQKNNISPREESHPPGNFKTYLPFVQFRINTTNEVIYQIVDFLTTFLASETVFHQLHLTKQSVVESLLHYYHCASNDCVQGSDPDKWRPVLQLMSEFSIADPMRMLDEMAMQHIDKAHDYLIESNPMRSEQILDLTHIPCLDEVGVYRQLKRQCPNIIFWDEKEERQVPGVHAYNAQHILPADFVSVVHRRIGKDCTEQEIQTGIVRTSYALAQMEQKKEQQKLLCLFGVGSVRPRDRLSTIRTPSNLMLLLNGLKRDVGVYPNLNNLFFLEEDVRFKITAGFRDHTQPWKALERLIFYFTGLWDQQKKKEKSGESYSRKLKKHKGAAGDRKGSPPAIKLSPSSKPRNPKPEPRVEERKRPPAKPLPLKSQRKKQTVISFVSEATKRKPSKRKTKKPQKFVRNTPKKRKKGW